MFVHAERALLWRYDAKLGWHHQPGQRARVAMPSSSFEVRINAKGLRGPDVPYERRAGHPRVLMLGDSQAWGFGVAEDETAASVLQTATGAEVINAAVSGFSTDQELQWLAAEGVRYRPDLVVLVVSGNDDWGNGRARMYWLYGKPRYRLTSAGLVLDSVPGPPPSRLRRTAQWARTHSALFYRAELLIERAAPGRLVRIATGEPASGQPIPFALTLALVDEIGRVAAAAGARLLVVTNAFDWLPPEEFPRITYRDFVDALRRRGSIVIDTTGDTEFDGARMNGPDGHWNADGHRFVAGRIGAAIERHRLLSAPAPNQVRE
jgi:lysophospholipase L1-like esterase